jgi:trehalose 6-phosphate synthase
MATELLVASNRGPVSFSYGAGGELTARRGGGGLVSGLSAATSAGDALWVCAALSDADRDAAGRSGGRIEGEFDAPLRMLDIDPETYDNAYNGIANSVLWFVNHMLYDTPVAPVFDSAFRAQWDSYVTYNQAFADALASEAAQRARVIIQDYHLLLAPAMLRKARPDVRIAHFLHTPWSPPEYFGMLPDYVAKAIVEGVLGADHAGFLTARWAKAFAQCAAELDGVSASDRGLTRRDRTTELGVHALGVDGPALRSRGAEADAEEALDELNGWADGRQVVLRIDRTELSKNIVRGLLAFRDLLRTHPELHEQVVHLVIAYPSRGDLAEYREYVALVERTVADINQEFATPTWEPIRAHFTDNYPRALAAMRLADVLVVNPIRDGMNLVAKEGPILSDAGLALVLSREAGAAAELGDDAFMVNPYDTVATAEAIYAGLALDPAKRRWRCDRIARIAASRSPQQWFAEQLAALD